MLNQVPLSITILFIATTIISLGWIIAYFKSAKLVNIILVIWLVFQAILSSNGFYEVNDTFPPRFVLMVMPPILFIVFLFNTKNGKAYIDGLDIEKLTLLHIIRIPVEIVLFGLFAVQLVPKLMTFEGANFDIFSGISAPIVYLAVLRKNNYNKNILLIWNVICLLLLFTIVAIAILSAPSPFQTLNFDQPNIGILYFPFNWLPSFIVPLVLFAHLATFRKILYKK